MADQVLDQVLRFHLRVDAGGRLVHLGPSLRRLLGPVLGLDIRTLADSDDLSIDGADAAPTHWPGRLVRLRFREPLFTLRGEFVADPEVAGGSIFAATLDPEDVGRLRELGLSAGDFAGSDLTMEFSMLKWARDSQVRETKSALERLATSVRLGETLKVEARTDSLTGIANRAEFIERLEAALSANRSSERSAAVIMIDVDRFKSINDLHGHQVGDQVLIWVARQLTETVGDAGLVARMGGDEFAIVIPSADTDTGTETETETEVDRLARRLGALNGQQLRHDEGVTAIGLSMGMAVQQGEIDCGELLRNADIAMYAGRRSETGAIGVFDPAAQHDLDLRRAIADDLSNALASGQIELYFQPIVDLETLVNSGFEVLSRWLHPEHGLIPPELFVEVAERCQIVRQLDHYVVRNAIAAAHQFLLHDGQLPTLSINFSALSLTGDLASFLTEVLAELDFPPSKLCVEITETTSIADLGHTAKILNELAEMGITISLDDFGTGFSSLTYLHQLPIGALKIDRSFVTAMLKSQKALEVVRSIIQVASSLSLPVVAEGVETPDQHAILRDLGCALGQGYYFATPAPPAEARLTLGRRLPLSERSFPRNHPPGYSEVRSPTAP